MLNFEGINNIRDLGHLPVSGGFVKSGLLLRAARLDAATDGDIDRLVKMNIKHIIDFRDQRERDEFPDRPVPNAQVHHLSALRPLSGKMSTRMQEITAEEISERFKGIYRYMAQGNNAADAYTKFFKILLETDGAVLWHCTQGKDRTGIASMLLLTALGASEKTIRQDYFETNTAMQKVYNAYAKSGVSEERLLVARQYMLVHEEFLEEYFKTMKEEHDSIFNYLLNVIELSQDNIMLLREKYTYSK